MGVSGQHYAPAALPPGMTQYPLYTRPGGPHGRSGRVRKISPPPGFDHRTVQPVASRYTECAIPAHNNNNNKNNTLLPLLYSRVAGSERSVAVTDRARSVFCQKHSNYKASITYNCFLLKKGKD